MRYPLSATSCWRKRRIYTTVCCASRPNSTTSAAAPSATGPTSCSSLGMDLARELLPVLDDFERALKVECADPNYSKGVELIYQRLARHPEENGRRADRSRRQKVRSEPAPGRSPRETDEVDDQTVLEEFQRGYNFKGKLLRPAMVKVAVRP